MVSNPATVELIVTQPSSSTWFPFEDDNRKPEKPVFDEFLWPELDPPMLKVKELLVEPLVELLVVFRAVFLRSSRSASWACAICRAIASSR